MSDKIGNKFLINFRKLSIGLGVGLILAVIFVSNLSESLDFFLIRWEYIVPPILAIFYLSVQPYLNYASHKRYFASGAIVGTCLAVIILVMNAVIEYLLLGQNSELISNNPISTLVSYFLFIFSYSIVSGLGHYLFNINVEPEKKDIKKNQYFGLSLIVGAFSFVIVSLYVSSVDRDMANDYYALLVPAAISAFIVVKLHHLQPRAFYKGLVLGGITGLLLGLLQAIVVGLMLLIQILFNREFVDLLFNQGFTFELTALAIMLPLLTLLYTIIGSFTGFTMKLLKTLL